MKIRLIERFALIGWAVIVLYVFAAFRGRIHPKGMLGGLLDSFFAYLSAAYLQ
jgi:hypothetical protein